MTQRRSECTMLCHWLHISSAPDAYLFFMFIADVSTSDRLSCFVVYLTMLWRLHKPCSMELQDVYVRWIGGNMEQVFHGLVYDTVIVFVWRDWINPRKSLFIFISPSCDFKSLIMGIWMRGLHSCSTQAPSNCSCILLACLSFLPFDV
jgi:hypothetical protein